MADYIVSLLDNLLLPTTVPRISALVSTYFPTVIAGLFGLFVSITLVRLIAKLL